MISVVLATYNEAHNLERCLASIKDLADEIIVVDGSSSDGTAALAKKLGAKVIETTNKPIFHINKQMAMDAAKGELVLQLDADEVVDAELHAFIKKVHSALTKGTALPDGASAWWIRRKNLFLGRFLTKGGQYPDPVIRLYLQGKATLPQKDVHEQMAVEGTVGWAKGHLIHYANPTFADYLRKWNTYTSLQADQWHREGMKPSLGKGFLYIFWKPLSTFCNIYLLHKGFVDGFAGFMFALWSGLFFIIAYLKLWEKSK